MPGSRQGSSTDGCYATEMKARRVTARIDIGSDLNNLARLQFWEHEPRHRPGIRSMTAGLKEYEGILWADKRDYCFQPCFGPLPNFFPGKRPQSGERTDKSLRLSGGGKA